MCVLSRAYVNIGANIYEPSQSVFVCAHPRGATYTQFGVNKTVLASTKSQIIISFVVAYFHSINFDSIFVVLGSFVEFDSTKSVFITSEKLNSTRTGLAMTQKIGREERERERCTRSRKIVDFSAKTRNSQKAWWKLSLNQNT